MKTKTLTIELYKKLNVDSDADDLFALSYIVENEDGALDNVNSWHPLNCNENGDYNIVQYSVYTEVDLVDEIKNAVASIENLELVYMNGPNYATFKNKKTENLFTIRFANDKLTINNIYFSNACNIEKYLTGQFILFR